MGQCDIPTRMLIVDYALSSEAVVEGVAYHYARAGCTVDFRPGYPNLVRADLSTYRVIALLAGRTPDFPSARMSAEEAEAAARFVRRGGALILAPNLEGGEGAHERGLYNHLLDELGIPIEICDAAIEDPDCAYPACMGDRPLYAPVPGHPAAAGAPDRIVLERSTPLRAGDGADVVATTLDTARPDGRMPVVALGRAGKGWVLVAGRYVLNATGIPLRLSGEPLVHPEWLEETEPFLTGLARHLVRLVDGRTEWCPGNPCPIPLQGDLPAAGAGFSRAPVLDRVPDGVRTIELAPPELMANDFDRDLARHYEDLPVDRLYGWIRRDGVRASWGRTVDPDPAAFDREAVLDVGRALSDCGVNLFWGISNCQAMAGPGYSAAEREAVAQRWDWTAEALEGTDVKWYPTLDYRYFRDEETRCLGAQGQVLEAPSPVDLEFWWRGWRDPLCAIAEYSLAHKCIGGIALDVELYAHPPAYNYYSGYGFDDPCFEFATDRLRDWGDAGMMAEAGDLPQAERYDWLRVHGLLDPYFRTLSAEVERACREVRDAAWAINPDLLFASYIFTTPCNWFDLGLYRGFSSPERPVVLMTFNIQSGRMLQHLRRDRVYAYHASVALLGMIGPGEHETVFANAFRLGHGYWMNNINALLAGARDSCESPGQRGISPQDAVRLIRQASDNTGPNQ